MRTRLLFLPLLLLRNELLVGNLLPLCCCSRDSDEVDDEKDDDGVPPPTRRRRGSELYRGSSFTFNFTLNILYACLTFVCYFRSCFKVFFLSISMPTGLEVFFQIRIVSRATLKVT